MLVKPLYDYSISFLTTILLWWRVALKFDQIDSILFYKTIKLDYGGETWLNRSPIL